MVSSQDLPRSFPLEKRCYKVRSLIKDLNLVQRLESSPAILFSLLDAVLPAGGAGRIKN